MNVNVRTSCEVLLDKRSHLRGKEVEVKIFLNSQPRKLSPFNLNAAMQPLRGS